MSSTVPTARKGANEPGNVKETHQIINMDYELAFNTKGHHFRTKEIIDKWTIKICIRCFCEVILKFDKGPHDTINTWQPYEKPVYIEHNSEETLPYEPECDSSPLKELAFAYIIRKQGGLETKEKN